MFLTSFKLNLHYVGVLIHGLILKLMYKMKLFPVQDMCERIDPFTITAVLHSSGIFLSGKLTISRGNRDDVIHGFNCSTTSLYGKWYYSH